MNNDASWYFTHTNLCRKDTPIPAATATRIDTSASKHASNVTQVAGYRSVKHWQNHRGAGNVMSMSTRTIATEQSFCPRVPLVPYNSSLAITFNSFLVQISKTIAHRCLLLAIKLIFGVCNVKPPERFVEHVWSLYLCWSAMSNLPFGPKCFRANQSLVRRSFPQINFVDLCCTSVRKVPSKKRCFWRSNERCSINSNETRHDRMTLKTDMTAHCEPWKVLRMKCQLKKTGTACLPNIHSSNWYSS